MAILNITGLEDNQKISAFNNIPVEVVVDDQDNSLVKAEVYHNNNLVNTVFSPILLKDGSFKSFFNLRQTLTSLLFDYKEITSTPTNQNKLIDIIISEVQDSGTPDTTTFSNIIIYKAIDINLDYWGSGSTNFIAISKEDLVDRYIISGQDIYIAFYTSTGVNSIYDYGNSEVVESGISLYNDFGCSSKLSLTKKPETILLGIGDDKSDTNMVRINMIEKKYPRKKMLYWLNEFGGWDFYPFVDYEETEKTNKNQYTKFSDIYGNTEVYQYIENKHRRLKLYGLPGVTEKIGFLKGLLNSPIVLDEDNKKVRVISDRIKWDQSGIIEPEINIEYIDEQVINF